MAPPRIILTGITDLLFRSRVPPEAGLKRSVAQHGEQHAGRLESTLVLLNASSSFWSLSGVVAGPMRFFTHPTIPAGPPRTRQTLSRPSNDDPATLTQRQPR